MYRKQRVCAIIPAKDEASSIGLVVSELKQLKYQSNDLVDDVIVCRARGFVGGCRLCLFAFLSGSLVDGFAQFHGRFGHVLDAGFDLARILALKRVLERGDGQFDHGFIAGMSPAGLFREIRREILGVVDQKVCPPDKILPLGYAGIDGAGGKELIIGNIGQAPFLVVDQVGTAAAGVVEDPAGDG